MPRIVGLSMVKNEQDIIEPFVRHNLQFVDFLVILDNNSVDGTREILSLLMKENDKVIVTDVASSAYAQSERMTLLMHSCQASLYADYFVFLDADEFIDCKSREYFENCISKIPSGGYGKVPWKSYVLVPTDGASENIDPPRSMSWRRRDEGEQWYKAVVRLDGLYWHDLVVSQGNHSISSSDGRHVPSTVINDCFLNHYPLRSLNQFTAKCVVGWMAYLAKDPLATQKVARGELGYHWYENFKMISAGASALSYDMVCELSFRYAQHSLTDINWKSDIVQESSPVKYERRYSSGSYPDAATVIIRSWQASIEQRPPLLELRRANTQLNETSAGATSFDADWHWDNTFADLPPFIYIGEKRRLLSVLDVGCGIGAYLRLFSKLGIKDVQGVDGIPFSTTGLSQSEYRQADLTQPLRFDRRFDLVMCLEVVEHLPAAASTALLDTIAEHAQGLILFSAACPGQPGVGHINCQPLEFWLSEWAKRGWAPDLAETLSVRALSTLPWFKHNLLLLKKHPPEQRGDVGAELRRISEVPIIWPNSQPGIRHEVLMDGADELPAPPPVYARRRQAPPTQVLRNLAFHSANAVEAGARFFRKLEQRL